MTSSLILYRACTFGLSLLAFILVEAIPIFNYLLALSGSVCFAPLALILPMVLWLYDYSSWYNGSVKQKLIFAFHVLIILIGAFLSVGGTYATVQSIIDAYANNTIGKFTFLTFGNSITLTFHSLGSAFSCDDNSNST
jgi:hypothetical protein